MAIFPECFVRTNKKKGKRQIKVECCGASQENGDDKRVKGKEKGEERGNLFGWWSGCY